ncbi:helix-turn-helix transcriptional regulator [Lapillicoccus jejuensis]|uniref:AraC-like DNA-binding protein n=1 Tax=Lapillicoccus jejuensis TaxID=402171 RepID=A0A542E4M0_9MICO|nr:AraC family transcriptional regulator [Lapillicoccus jejuensis]TQJ10267.1 AraC-like DNA-binding protein [Lapillicoccus jejuensis]
MSRDVVRAWRPAAVPGVTEVLHARFVRHAYPAHTHAAWTLLLVDTGGVLYDLERAHHDADRRAVTLLPPGVPHDGRAATGDGFRKRVVYLEDGWLPRAALGVAVRRPALADRGLVTAVDALHAALGAGDDLEAETRLALVRDRVVALVPSSAGGADDGPRARPGRPGRPGGPDRRTVAVARERLDAGIRAAPTLTDLAAELDVAATSLVRAFAREVGVAPHRYLVGRRVDAARRLLLEGVPPAQVAAETGFHDQSHLTRHFRRVLGVTPGAYARSATVRPG